MRAGKFPRGRIVGGRSMWLSSEIDAWIAELPPGQIANPTRELSEGCRQIANPTWELSEGCRSCQQRRGAKPI
jgi:Prophage CP4-57 regulatory protein (AlpA)